jgi:DNA-binding MarR family transcriptional regulator
VVEDETTLRFVEALYRVNRLIVDDARAHVAEVGALDVSDFMALRAAAPGALTVGDLSRRLSTHPAATSRTISRLVRAGLIERRHDPADARRTVLGLTAEGTRVSALIAARIRPELRHRLGALGRQRTTALIDALTDLLGAD